ncbi:MAG: L,D-transpeptidase family protein [Methylophilaceae bacterium]
MLHRVSNLLLMTCLLFQFQAIAEPISMHMIGGVSEYSVQSGDTLTKIGARFGVSAKLLASENGLLYNSKLNPQQTIKIDNQHIVPSFSTGNLLINVPQKMLFSFNNGELLNAFPVALGKATWQTPLGEFSVNNKVANKTWLVPKSIQEEMRREGRTVLTKVPPGKNNPLGKYWLGLSLEGIGIHGTIAPASIYQFRSHGCIRLHPDDIEALFLQTERGATGTIIYEPLLMAEVEGKVYIEAHADIYELGTGSLKTLEKIAQEHMLSERIDWQRAENVLKSLDGIARDVTISNETLSN